MPFRNPEERIKKNYTNEALAYQEEKKNNLLMVTYPSAELDTSIYFAELFAEAMEQDLLMPDYEYHCRKCNGKMFIYSPKLSQKLHKKGQPFTKVMKKLTLTQDNIDTLEVNGFNGVLSSVNLHYGLNSKSLAYLCNIDIDFDGIYTEYDMQKLIELMEDGKILKPTLLVSTGTGVHLIYRLKMPVKVYKDNERQLAFKMLKSALCKKLEIAYGFNSKYKGFIKPLALDQKIRTVGSTTKIGETKSSLKEALKHTTRAWELTDSYTFEALTNYCQEYFAQAVWTQTPKKNRDDKFELKNSIKKSQEIIKGMIEIESNRNAKLNLPVSKYKTVITTRPDKAYTHVNRNLYDGYKKKAMTARVGSRYFAMLALASCAHKCNIDEEELRNDLEKLKNFYNGKYNEPITNDDINAVLNSYHNNTDLKYYKIEYFNNICGFLTKHSKRNGKTREAHLNKLRKLTGRKSKKSELFAFLSMELYNGKNVRNMSCREIASKSGISKSTVARFFKKIISKLTTKINNHVIKPFQPAKMDILLCSDAEKMAVLSCSNSNSIFLTSSVPKSLLLYGEPYEGSSVFSF